MRQISNKKSSETHYSDIEIMQEISATVQILVLRNQRAIDKNY